MKPKTKSELMAEWANQPDQLKKEREVKAVRKAMDDARAAIQDGLTRYVKKKTKARSMAKAESDPFSELAGWESVEQINGVFKCECIVDIDSTTEKGAKVYTEVKAKKEGAGVSSEHAYPLWPCFRVGSYILWASAVVAARTAYLDAANDNVPYLSPSNKTISITGTCLADGTEVVLDQVQANALNGVGVTTAINQSGWRLWGNNTAAYPGSTDPKDRWFCCRRFFSWWGNSFILTYIQYVDGPVSVQLVENIVDSENIRGNSYVAQNKCAGAHINFRAEENTATDIISGEVKFHQKLAPFVPAEDITNTLEFDPAMLYASINGGSN